MTWFNPVAISLGPLSVHWYGLSYVLGILCAWFVTRYCIRNFWLLNTKPWDDMISPIIWGILIGGRLGQVLFFDLTYYFHNPLEIFMVWKGGMSFHGGFLGVLAAIFYGVRKANISFLKLTDGIACGAPWGLFWGRIANFINGELYGRPSDVPWACVFPMGGNISRHPSQIYEALLEGVLLGALIFWQARKPSHTGYLSGLFVLGYGVARFCVEFVREIDWIWLGLTSGQWLCIPMIGLGLWLVCRKN